MHVLERLKELQTELGPESQPHPFEFGDLSGNLTSFTWEDVSGDECKGRLMNYHLSLTSESVWLGPEDALNLATVLIRYAATGQLAKGTR